MLILMRISLKRNRFYKLHFRIIYQHKMKDISLSFISIIILTLCSCSKDSEESQSVNPNIIWQKAIGSYTEADNMWDLEKTLDGGYIISSYGTGGGGDKSEATAFHTTDYWVVKIDRDANVIWDNTLGGEGVERHPSVSVNSDNSYIVFGSSISNASKDKSEDSRGLFDYWVVKLDGEGKIIWDKTFGGSGQEKPGRVIENSEGYLLIGTSNSPISGDKTIAPYIQNKYDLWLVQIDFDGNKIWDKIIGGLGDEQISEVIKTSDGGYLIGVNAKNSSSSIDKSENSLGLMDCWLIKLDANANIVWENTLGGLGDDLIKDIEILTNGNILVSATSGSNKSNDKSEDNKGYSDVWLLMLNGSGDIIWDKTIGGTWEDAGGPLVRTPTGRNFVAAISNSKVTGDKTIDNYNVSFDCWLIEFDDLGEMIDQSVIGGIGIDLPWALHYTQNGNLFIGIQSRSANNTGDKKLTRDVPYTGNFWLLEWNIQ